MRFLLIALVIALIAWRWRSSRSLPHSQHPSATAETPISMSCCKQCGVHVPESDAIAGSLGVYCSREHRKQAES